MSDIDLERWLGRTAIEEFESEAEIRAVSYSARPRAAFA